MKRKILLGMIALSLICGTAYAAVNGTYKGREIIRVLVNGKEVHSTVPAQLIDGSTMLPLRAIGESLGATVGWDNKSRTATVTVAEKPAQSVTGLSLAELNRIGESVAKVYALNSAGQTIATGSAFLTQQTVVTNSHVLDGAVSIRVEFIKEEQTYRVTEALFNDAEKDLAGFAYTGSKKSLMVNRGELKRGDKVYSIGFPQGRFAISEGEITAFTTWGNDIIHSAQTDNGSSGGALIDSQGRVVGVNAGGTDGTQYNRAVHRDKLLEVLAK